MPALKKNTFIVIVFISFFLVLSLLLYFFSTKHGERIIRNLLEKKLEQTFGCHVSIASLETNLLSHVQLQNIEITQISGSDKNPFLSIDIARIEYRLSRLLSKDTFINTVIIDRMAVYVMRDSSGYHFLHVQDKKKHEDVSKPYDLRFKFDSLDLIRSSVTLADHTIPLNVTTDNITLHFRKEDTGGHIFYLNADSWKVDYHEHPFSVTSLAIDGSISDEHLTIEKFELELPELHCTMTSTIDITETPFQISGEVNLHGNPQKLAELFKHTIPHQFYPLNGNMETVIGFSGTTFDPNISFSMNVHDLELKNTILDSIIIHGAYEQKKINLNKIQVELLDGIMKGQGKIQLDSLLTHDFFLSIEGMNIERALKLIYDDYSPYKGKINGELQTSGPVKNVQNLSVTSHLSLEEILFQNQKLTDFKIDVSYDRGKFNVQFNQSDTNLTASATVIDDELQGKFNFHTTKPEGLAGFAKIVELYGSVDATGTLSGSVKEPILVAQFNGEHIRFHGFPLDTLRGRIRYEQGGFVIEESTFAGSLASVDSLTQPFTIPDLGGSLKYSGKVFGPVSNPEGNIDISLSEPSYRNVRLESIDAAITVKDKRIVIERCRLVKDSLVVNLKGNHAFPTKKGFIEFTLLNPMLIPVHPEVMQKIPDTNTTDIFQKAYLGKVSCEYDFALPDNGLIDVKGMSLPLDKISQVFNDSLDVHGIFDINFHCTGSLRQPAGNLHLSVQSPEFKGVHMDSIDGDMVIEPNKLTLQKMTIFLNNQRTTIQGDIELEPSPVGYPIITNQSMLHFLAEGKNVSIQLVKLLLPQETVLTGESSYRLECRGKLGNPIIKGAFGIQNANLSLKPNTPTIEGINISTTFLDSMLVIDHASGLIGATPFQLNGRIATYDWKQFRTEINIYTSDLSVFKSSGIISRDSLDYTFNIADFEIDLLRMTLPDLQNLGGKADAFFTINGSISDPSINGKLNVSDVSFLLPLYSIPVSQGTAALRFEQNAVYLDSLSAMVNGGKWFSYGNAIHHKGELTELDLTAVLQNMNINRPKEYTLLVDSANLTCRKRGVYYDLDGDIQFGQSRLIKEFQPTAILPFTNKVDRPSRSPHPVSQKIRMNIVLHGDRNLWIDNNIARFRFSSDIGLIGTLAYPKLNGRLSVEEGYIIYLDKRFKIVRGVMDFNDPTRINPVIDLQAVTSLKSYQTYSKIPYDITLSVTGPLDQTVLELFSEPQQDKSDIVTLLTVGATRKEITGSSADGTGGSLGDILRERAEELSSKKISGYFSQKVGTLLGLEDITIEGNLFNISKSSGPQLIASERITDRMGITYTTTVGHLNEQRVRLDYRLNRFFSLEGETDQKGRAGIDVKYKLRFK